MEQQGLIFMFTKLIDKDNKLKKAQEHATNMGGVCLSNAYINNSFTMEWKCHNSEHKSWFASYEKVMGKTKTWCPHCSGRISNIDKIKKANKHAESKNGKCLSKECNGIFDKLEWKCSNENHSSWISSYDSVIRGSWCPKCGIETRANKKKLQNGLQKAQQYAESKGGKCLSEIYINQKTKLEWTCSNINHKSWFSTFEKAVLLGRWCPECGIYYYKEHIIRNLLDYLLDTKFIKTKPKWNINPKTNNYLELDGYSETLRIAFEFQGEHHYKEGVFSNTKDDLEYIQFKDKIKKQNCENNNIKLLVIDNKFQLSQKKLILNYILKLLNEHHIIITKKINEVEINNIFNLMISHQENYLNKAKEVALSKHGQCLSEIYINANEHLRWRCAIGHEWNAPYSRVVISNSWCLQCTHIDISKRYRNKNGLKEAQNYAISKNGNCLSDEYINSNTKMKWRCYQNHEWESSYKDIKRNKWCPKCSGKFSKEEGLDNAKEFAFQNNGKCLSEKYINATTKMEWQCAKEHKWFGTYNFIQQGGWCPKCSGNFSKIERLNMAKNYAKLKNGNCLSVEYLNIDSKMEWQCSNINHPSWYKSYYKVVSLGEWCPKCFKKK